MQPVAVRESDTLRRRRVGWGYLVALVGPAATSVAYVAVHEFVDPGIFALVLVLSVLGAAVLGGRTPAAGAAALSFIGLDLFHEPPSGWPRFSLQEIELLGSFVVVAAATVALVHWGMGMRERQVRAEQRWDRLGRVLEAVSAGVSARQLVPIVEHELTNELDLDMVRYEPEPRTTCDYDVGRHGGLHHGGERLEGLHLRLPAEPVRVPVQFRGHDLGQLVLIPERDGPVTEDQLLLTANLTSVLAETLHEDRAGAPGDPEPVDDQQDSHHSGSR